MFADLVTRLAGRHGLRDLLQRTDDRLLEDIGLTRIEAEQMLASQMPIWAVGGTAPAPAQPAACPAD